MVDIFLDSLTDTVKTLPILFIFFLLTDYLMNRVNKGNKLIDKFSKYDCLGGAFLGIIPQCGISVAMAKLYSGGLITLGMLFAVFIASSDEAIIIIGSHPDKLVFMLQLIGIKIVLGTFIGYLINIFIKEKRTRIKIHDLSCNCSKCRVDNGLIVRNIVYTLKVFVFLLITVFIINLGMEKIGEDSFHALLGKNTIFQPVYASLVGMIPSCMSSVVLAEAFIKGAIGFGPLLSGLCSNTGFGILIIFKELPIKKALKVTVMLQIISITIGEIIFSFT